MLTISLTRNIFQYHIFGKNDKLIVTKYVSFYCNIHILIKLTQIYIRYVLLYKCQEIL